jgi:peptide/nickel transport system permease protein
MLPVLFIISVTIFTLVRVMPIDPIYAMLGQESDTLSPEQHDALMKQLGLDRPLPVQYVTWVGDFVTGDWGNSFRSKLPVVKELGTRLPYTLQLAGLAFFVSLFIGVTTGVVAALKRNTVWDMGATTAAIFGIALPDFWFALMMIILFGVMLEWLPTFGSALLWEEPLQALKYLVLPALALGLNGSATIMRQTRSALLEVIGEDYIRTARAKGLAENRVIWVHAVRNSLLPVVTILGLRIGNILGGAVIIETMFSWPGVGLLSVNALRNADYPVVQTIVILSAIAILLANLLTDLVYGYLDPRIRYG